MEGSLEDLIEQLYRLFTGGNKVGVISSESVQGTIPTVPSHLFAIIDEVLLSLTPSERARQATIAMAHLVDSTPTDVAQDPANTRGSAALTRPARAANEMAAQLCVTVLTSCALLASTPAPPATADPTDLSTGTDAETAPSHAQQIQTWESCALRLFSANPPFPESVVSCAAYGAARLTLQQWALSPRLVLGAACAAVQRLAPSVNNAAGMLIPAPVSAFTSVNAADVKASAPLDVHVAVEVLAQVTALLALDSPLRLSGVIAPPPPSTATSHGKGKTSKADRGQGKGKTVAHTTSPTASAATGNTKSTYAQPLGLDDSTIRTVREGIIQSALYALGGADAVVDIHTNGTDARPRDDGNRTLTGRRDHVLSSLVCRRVLIPLLLVGGDDTLLTYEPVVHRLLCMLGGAPAEEAMTVDAAHGNTSPPSVMTHTLSADTRGSEDDATVQECAAANGEAEERRGEVVVLMAALFDFLFRAPDLTPENDYRFSPFLWRTLYAALYDAIATPHIDAGRRANMQLRVEYLLKRLVDLTQQQEGAAQSTPAATTMPIPSIVVFHSDLFTWCTRSPISDSTQKRAPHADHRCPGSARSWSYFFLVLEALNEFGWHIIQPALVKLDALVEELQVALEAHASSPSSSSAAPVVPLASAWIELLHLKLILHPNLGVRKVGLRRTWRLPACVLATFSQAFLFTHVLESATDPRLCVELDRTPITATFLETKAFEGQEVCAVPDLEPLAYEVEHFYAHLFLHQLQSAQSRTSALRCMLRSLLSKPPRFTVSVAVRTLHHLAQQLLVQEAHSPEKQAWTRAMVLDDEVLASLSVFLRDSIQENIPFWLDVRVTAIIFSTFLHFAALAPRAFRTDSRFWRLWCLCGPLGQSGGKSIARMDACGSSYGCVGASLDPVFVHAKVAHFVREELPAVYAPTLADKRRFLSDLLLLDTVTERTRDLLHLTTSASSGSFDEVAVKQHFFLLGAPLAFEALVHDQKKETRAPSDRGAAAPLAGAEKTTEKPAWLCEICAMVSDAVVSLRRRSYPALGTTLTAIASLIALEQTLSPRHAAAFFPAELLREMLETVRGMAMQGLGVAHARMTVLDSADELNGPSTRSSLDVLTSSSAASSTVQVAERLEAWQLMQTDVWDVLTSGVASLHKVAVQRALSAAATVTSHAPHGDGTDTAADDVTIAGTALWSDFGTAEAVMRLVPLVQSCGVLFAADQQTHRDDASDADAQGAVSPSPSSRSVSADLARQAAQLVVARNTSRLLLSELCGSLFTEVEDRHADMDVEADAETATHRSPASLLWSTEGSLHRLSGPVPGLTSQATVELIQTLTHALTQRMTAGALPSTLSALPWPTLLAQHARAMYNAIYILAQSLSPTAASATPSALGGGRGNEPTMDDVERSMAREAIVPTLESFAVEQLECCWSNCLPSVIDLLVWVTSTHDPRVDYEGVIDAVFAHIHDVGARQHARASALAFSVLALAHPHAPAHVHDILMRTLKTEVDATDRNVYFAAITACLGVLQDPASHYDGLADVLVQCAVLYNSGRDEEENESTMATTEPLLRSWPEALRTRYPPTVRLSAVGRAFAISTLLWCCAQDGEGVRAADLVKQLLRMNTQDPIVTHEPCMPNSQTHRTRLRLWQLLCALLPTLPSENVDAVAPLFQILLDECVPINNMGSVRRFMELFAIRLLEAQPSLYTLVADALGDFALRPQVCGTFVLIASHALLHDQKALPPVTAGNETSPSSSSHAKNEDNADRLSREGRTPLFRALFPRLLQQSTSNQHLLRIISHIGVYVVCQARLAAGRTIPAEAAAVFDYIARAPEHVKLREKHQDMLFFDTEEACTPRSLFCVQRKEANTILQEHLPAAAFERIRFLETELDCLIGAVQPMELLRVRLLREATRTAALLAPFRTFTLIPHTHKRADYYVDYTAEATRMLVTDPLAAASADLSSAAADDDIQKKVASWWNGAVYNELHPRAVQRQTRQSLIIVGSLLENPVNIAGLCRCGEIFAVERITIPEKKVFDHPHFVATARSAELWIPWQEVAPRDLPTYLIAMREEGYTIVGIEQTASSVSIADFHFPDRAVVVLGAEGQGVPAPLIPLLDVCVEIPQYGLIRSLNVHVTGAITMFEYTRQKLMTATTASGATTA